LRSTKTNGVHVSEDYFQNYKQNELAKDNVYQLLIIPNFLPWSLASHRQIFTKEKEFSREEKDQETEPIATTTTPHHCQERALKTLNVTTTAHLITKPLPLKTQAHQANDHCGLLSVRAGTPPVLVSLKGGTRNRNETPYDWIRKKRARESPPGKSTRLSEKGSIRNRNLIF